MKKRKLFHFLLSIMMILSLLCNPVYVHAEESTNESFTEDVKKETTESAEIFNTEITQEVTEEVTEEIGSEKVTNKEETSTEEETGTEETTEAATEEAGTEETDTEESEETLRSVSVEEKVLSGYIKSSSNKLQTLSYEEFKQALKDETKTFSEIETSDKGRKTISDVTEHIYKMNDVTLDYELSVDISAISDADEGIAPMTLPTPNLNIYVVNTDSLKNGSATTMTVLLWLYNDTDADGDTILARHPMGFPEGYKLGEFYDDNDNEIGFVTNFFNPGTYTVKYYVMDSSQEMNGIQYTIDVLPVGDYTEYVGNLSSADAVDTYTIPIDYATISTAAVTFIQSGETDMYAYLKDQNGNHVAYLHTNNSRARRWTLIDKPDDVNGIYNYTLTISVYNKDFHEDSSGYKIAFGDKNDVEEMLSYIDGSVILGKYKDADKTYDCRTGYTPNDFESYFKITADGASTITALTGYQELRFKVLDAETLITLYDSEQDDTAHRGMESRDYVEKQRLGFTAGKEYYLVLYANSPISVGFVEHSITLSQGMGRLKGGYKDFTATSSITAGTSGYSPSATIPVSNAPKTAEVECVDFISTDGVNLSDLASFRVKPQYGLSVWRSSVAGQFCLKFPYTPDGNSNTPVNGNWSFGFKTALKTKTMKPVICIYYRYEYGD